MQIICCGLLFKLVYTLMNFCQYRICGIIHIKTLSFMCLTIVGLKGSFVRFDSIHFRIVKNDNKLFDLETHHLGWEVLPAKKSTYTFDKQNYMRGWKFELFHNSSSNNDIEQHRISASGKIIIIARVLVMFCYLNLIHVILVERIGANHSLTI